MSLLSDGYVSFQDSDIPRRKCHHLINGVQVDESKREDLALIARQNGFGDADELVSYFVPALEKLEEDEAFIVPKKAISKGIHEVIRKGDMTGVTFANIAHYRGALRLSLVGPHDYLVEHSETLAVGIPCFHNLVCRLIWDLRQQAASLGDAPFRVFFRPWRGQIRCWWHYENVPHVAGTQTDIYVMTVDEQPRVGLEKALAGEVSEDAIIGASEPKRSVWKMWQAPTQEECLEIEARVIAALEAFPFLTTIHGGTLFNYREQGGHDPLPGERLTLKSNWTPPKTVGSGRNEMDVDNAGIELYNEAGGYLGTQFLFYAPYVFDEVSKKLATYRLAVTRWNRSGDGHEVISIANELACLLPHVRATVVDSSGTRMALSGKSKKLVVRLDLDERIDLNAVLAEVHELMTRDPKDRSLTSKTPKGRE